MKLQIIAPAETGPVTLAGPLEIYEAEAARTALLGLLATLPALELDLGGVTACDTAGVQLLVAARKSAAAARKPFGITTSAPCVEECGRSLGVPPEHWQPSTP